MCGVIIKLWNKDARAVSVHVRHASVEVQVHCVNVVIGVVLGELHVVRVVPVVVCNDAVVRRTLVRIAFTVAIVFIVSILRRILLYLRYCVYRNNMLLAHFTLGSSSRRSEVRTRPRLQERCKSMSSYMEVVSVRGWGSKVVPSGKIMVARITKQSRQYVRVSEMVSST